MASRSIMTASAALLAVLGLCCLFIPELVATAVGHPARSAAGIQLAAGGALGIAMMNWMARGGTLGGIYGRPVIVGNFVAAGILTLVLLSAQLSAPTIAGLVASALLGAYWASFAWLLLRTPGPGAGPARSPWTG